MTNLSVVIPTYRRASILKTCLEHLERQTIADQIEVIVVSDGHDAATAALIKNVKFTLRQAQGKNEIRFFEIPKSQQGVARNKGVTETKSPICLFIGDDIFLAPDACEKHLTAHSQLSTINYPLSAVLGFTTWDPALEITPVMQWLEKSGWQFGYPMIEKYAHRMIPKNIQHRFTYTSHISVPISVALDHPFREDVTLYGWEDTEWGKRLADAGIGLFYEPDAQALHHHHLTLEQSLERMKELGKSIQQFPDSDRNPPLWKQWMYRWMIWRNPQSMQSKHRRAFLSGLQNN